MRQLKAVKAKVEGFVVVLTLNDGSVIERDFAFVDGPVFRRWRKRDGIDKRVKLGDGELSWPGEIDFCLDAVIWGGLPPKTRRRPLKRAAIGGQGCLIPAPWVSDI